MSYALAKNMSPQGLKPSFRQYLNVQAEARTLLAGAFAGLGSSLLDHSFLDSLLYGRRRLLSHSLDGCFLDGCPWDAIVMVETTEVEKEVGVMPI